MKDQKITASFVSLGCFKNLVDTEVLGGLLEKHDVRILSPYEESDWVIINTCGFIRDAKEESIDEILAALEKRIRRNKTSCRFRLPDATLPQGPDLQF